MQVDLFGCVKPEVFRIFTGRHALAAEAVLLRLCDTHFSETSFDQPDRDQVKNSIAATIESLPPELLASGPVEDAEPEMATSDYLYLKMRDCGWIEEVSDRWQVRVTMPDGCRRLMRSLKELKENVAKSFTGLVSQVSSLIDDAASDPEAKATNIDGAWETTIAFRRHILTIDAALASVTRQLNTSGSMDESIDVFFAEFVNKILIRDWTRILSKNNPWRSRHHVVRAVRDLTGSPEAMAKAALAYVEAGHAENATAAEVLLRKRLSEISNSFDDIEKLRAKIEQGQLTIEGRVRDVLRFIGRNPAILRDKVESCLRALSLLEDHVDLPCVIPFLNVLEPIGESRFPDAREQLPAPEPRVLRRPAADPYLARFIKACKDFDYASDPGPKQAAEFLLNRDIEADGNALAPRTGREWFIWRYIGLLALTGHGHVIKGWTLEPAEGDASCRYGKLPNFAATKNSGAQP